MKILKSCLVSLLIWMFVFQSPGFGQKASDLNLVLGDIETIPVKKVSRISITNPEIADISDAQSDKISILAKRTGQTSLFFWDDDGKHTVYIHVFTEDLSGLEQRIAQLFEEANIKTLTVTTNLSEGKVVISGNLSKEHKGAFEKIVESYGDQIMNLVKEEANDDIVQIDMQITELSSTLDRNLGFNWQTTALQYTETGLPTTGSKDWFKFGQFDRTTAIANKINLLVNEGRARDLSRPRILVSSGKEASINVGGEVPIKSTTTNAAGGSIQESISFKQYGVTLTVTPTIKEDDRVDVVMNVQISDVDKTFPVPATSSSEIAYKTRSAQTQLLLDDRQTVVFAGLLRYSDGEQINRVPYLSKIPLFGLLFKNKSKIAPDEAKEVVIILTPTIMRSKEYIKDQIKFHSKDQIKFEKEVEVKQRYEREDLPKVKMANQVLVAGTPEVAPVNAEAAEQQRAYVQSVQAKLTRTITYPAEALKDNWQGAAKLRILILRDGSLGDAAIIKSSGREVFDQAALNSAKNAAPYPAFPIEMKQEDLYVTLPIEYKNEIKATVVPEKIEPSATKNTEDQERKVAYVRDVQLKVSNSISYPEEAIKNNWQGTVKLKVHILKDGTLSDAIIDQSSGHSVFDKDALNSAKVAAPFKAFPSGMKHDDMYITIPIVYSNNAGAKAIAEAIVPAK